MGLSIRLGAGNGAFDVFKGSCDLGARGRGVFGGLSGGRGGGVAFLLVDVHIVCEVGIKRELKCREAKQRVKYLLN